MWKSELSIKSPCFEASSLLVLFVTELFIKSPLTDLLWFGNYENWVYKVNSLYYICTENKSPYQQNIQKIEELGGF